MAEEQKINEPARQDSPGRQVGLRTFSSDIAEAVKEGRGSVVKIAVAEYEKRQRERENVSPRSKKNIFLLAGGLVVLAGAAALLIFALWGGPDDQMPVTPARMTSLIYADQHTELPIDGLTGRRLAARLEEQLKPAGKTGTIENIYLTENGGRAGTVRFLTLLGAHAPPALIRSLTSEFMIGSYKTDGGGQAFVIFQTRDFANAFAGLLAWEGRLWDDFHVFLGEETPDLNQPSPTADFEDFLIKNKNARVLKRADGAIALLYIFLDEEKILIANDEKTAIEVLARGALR